MQELRVILQMENLRNEEMEWVAEVHPEFE